METTIASPSPPDRAGLRPLLLAFVLLAGPYYLNDFANIYVKDWRLWLFIDYAVMKPLPLLVIVALVRNGTLPASAFTLRPASWGRFVAAFLAATVLGTLIDQNGYALLAGWPGYPRLGGMPAIDSPLWNWIDLTFGLAAVGIVEELVFRGFLYHFLATFVQRPALLYALSGLLFGLIHWSLGGHAVVITGLIGTLFMLIYRLSRSLGPVMLAHFAINFIDFSGLIPKDIFQFVLLLPPTLPCG